MSAPLAGPGRAGQKAAPQELTATERASLAYGALVDKRAVAPVLLDMREITAITDYFLICNGTSNVHIRALSEGVLEALKAVGVRPYGVEGRNAASWILLDYGDLIVHVFAQEEREFYTLERLWSDAPRVEIEESNTREVEKSEQPT
jgi:ribosome-associated protein